MGGPGSGPASSHQGKRRVKSKVPKLCTSGHPPNSCLTFFNGPRESTKFTSIYIGLSVFDQYTVSALRSDSTPSLEGNPGSTDKLSVEMRMKALLLLMFGLGLAAAPSAKAEAGPKAEKPSIGLPPLPLHDDPSSFLDDDGAGSPPAPMGINPFQSKPLRPESLGKAPEPTEANLPISMAPALPPAKPREMPPLEPITKAAAPTAMSLPPLATSATTPLPPGALALPKPTAQQVLGPRLATPLTLPTLPTAAAVTTPAAPARAPSNSTEKMVETKVSLDDPTSVRGPEVAIVLTDGKFRPARLRLRAGETTRLLFTTLGHKPAALIIERLRVQKWLSRPEEAAKRTPASASAPWEANRELSSTRLTEISLDPVRGNYTFHDAISGATGEIIVE